MVKKKKKNIIIFLKNKIFLNKNKIKNKITKSIIQNYQLNQKKKNFLKIIYSVKNISKKICIEHCTKKSIKKKNFLSRFSIKRLAYKNLLNNFKINK